MLWSSSSTTTSCSDWLEGDPAQPPPPPERPARPQPRVAHLYNARRPLDAGQVGIPVVRGVGPRVPLRPARAGRPGFRQGAARSCSCASGTCTRTASSPPTSGRFGDVNPPVHAWAAWRVYKIEEKRRGQGDRAFLERVFHKLLLNFTWWVNRKDAEGNNIFEGGFLGLDNIGVFDRTRRCRPAAASSSPTARAGWRCIASTCWRSRSSSRARTRPTRTSRASSSSTSSTSRAR